MHVSYPRVITVTNNHLAVVDNLLLSGKQHSHASITIRCGSEIEENRRWRDPYYWDAVISSDCEQYLWAQTRSPPVLGPCHLKRRAQSGDGLHTLENVGVAAMIKLGDDIAELGKQHRATVFIEPCPCFTHIFAPLISIVSIRIDPQIIGSPKAAVNRFLHETTRCQKPFPAHVLLIAAISSCE